MILKSHNLPAELVSEFLLKIKNIYILCTPSDTIFIRSLLNSVAADVFDNK